jgi:putative oxidoreductase
VVKFLDVPGTAAYIAAKGMPFPQLLAAAAGAVEVLAGVLIAVGWQTRLAAVALALFTVAAAIIFHDFWNLPRGAEQISQMVHALKNLSIMGGLVVLAGAGAGRWSLDARAR